MNLFWTPAKEKVLRELWGHGPSAREIGLKVGASRNAVIGKTRRMGLTSAVPPVKPRLRPSRAKKPKPLPRVKTPIKEPKYTTLHAAMMGLTPNSCRWISGDPCKDSMAFCGVPAFEGKSYCEEHCYVAYYDFGGPRTFKGQKR
jgi:GcrA cell cycle regulator